MGILSRFSDIISANINALLDKAEDPAKMVDHYLRKMTEDLAAVKRETAGVMAEESRTKRLVEENSKEISKYEELAKKALLAGNEDDARVFLTKKQEYEVLGASLETAYAAAHENAIKMRQSQTNWLKTSTPLHRRQAIRPVTSCQDPGKGSTAGRVCHKIEGSKVLQRMEEKADRMLMRPTLWRSWILSH